MIIIASNAFHSIRLECDVNADFDSEFHATCLDTGESLIVKGWLFNIEIEA